MPNSNEKTSFRGTKAFTELTGLLIILLIWWTFTDFLDTNNKGVLPSYIIRLINYLSRHKRLHNISNKAINSILGKAFVTLLSFILAVKYSKIKKDMLDKLTRYISSISDSGENSIANILKEMGSSDDKLKSLNEGFQNFDIMTKTRLLRHLFYSIILRSLNRRIIKLRFMNHDNYVPNLSIMFFSPIDKCNLKCKGCVTGSDRHGNETPSLEKMDYVINQAKRLNVFHIVITGKGEPFYDQDSKDKLLALAKRHSDLNFIIYTNGTTLQERDIKKISNLTNIYLILSIDGLEEINDARRGKGVYRKVINLIGILNRHGINFGYCATVYRDNYHHITSDDFVNAMVDLGCKFGVYLGYVPLAKDAPSEMILTKDDELEYYKLYDSILGSYPIPLIDLSKAEQKHGCRAREGTMIHIDGVTGKVSPCVKTPFAPLECNIYHNSHKDRLLEILQMDFFRGYRKNFIKGKHCSSKFCDEINEFLNMPDISLEELEKLRSVRENLAN